MKWRAIVTRDAACSASDARHDTVPAMPETRLSVQVEVSGVEAIPARRRLSAG
ncbi:hypothetical protein V5F49_13315 [Xanthobacter sp. V3C-3]|uniref:hypothetical protein n=1 Tax=Xanthobacter lutulentifluminis TaxID=3119935 RepID=UPI00372C35D3